MKSDIHLAQEFTLSHAEVEPLMDWSVIKSIILNLMKR